MSVFVNGLFVGSEIYPGVYAEALAGPSWMIRKENAQGWPCRVGEVKGSQDSTEFLACSCLGDVMGRAVPDAAGWTVSFIRGACRVVLAIL